MIFLISIVSGLIGSYDQSLQQKSRQCSQHSLQTVQGVELIRPTGNAKSSLNTIWRLFVGYVSSVCFVDRSCLVRKAATRVDRKHVATLSTGAQPTRSMHVVG